MVKENNTSEVNSALIEKAAGDNVEYISSEKMQSDFKKWGIALIILGILHIILPDVLLLVWGLCLIVAGICNFIFKSKAMYIVNGVTLGFVGIMNLTFTLLEGDDYFWLILGILQIYWGAREILKYKKVRVDVDEGIKEETKDELPIGQDFRKKNSKLGIASFVIFCVTAVLGVLFMALSMANTYPDGQIISEDSPQAIIAGFIFLLSALLIVVGIAIGIAGLFEKDKNRIYAILGICLNCFLLMVVVLLSVMPVPQA